MRNIKISQIIAEVKNLLIKASFYLPDDIVAAVKEARENDTSQNAKAILDLILENEKIAREEKLPLCQDCGTVYINLEIGKNICILPCSSGSEYNSEYNLKNFNSEYDSKDSSGNSKKEIDKFKSFIIYMLNSAVADIYKSFYLRKSIVSDPLFERKNTSNNTSAVISSSFVDSGGLGIEVNLKGGGSENCSWLFMLNPSADEDEIADIVLELIKEHVTKACPPVIIGIGIGSTASEVTKLALKATFRNLSLRNSNPRYQKLEKKILKRVNETGIGPQGLGGITTALACNIECAPCHMATLPLAVFFGCHSTRRANIWL
jgi:fumarate hydratase subunit alpha